MLESQNIREITYSLNVTFHNLVLTKTIKNLAIPRKKEKERGVSGRGREDYSGNIKNIRMS